MDSKTRTALVSLAQALLALQAQITEGKESNPGALSGLMGLTNNKEEFNKHISEFIKALQDE